MGLNIIKSFVRTIRNGAKVTDVKCDPGGGAINTNEHFSAPGDDGHPLKTDIALSVPVPGAGRQAVVGYVDTVNAGVAAEGEKRIFSRNGNGAIVAEVWLKNDGTIIAENDSVGVTLNPDGSASMDNGTGSIEIAADGTVEAAVGTNTFTLNPNGSTLLTNGTGSLAMLVDGSVNINGLVISPAGVMVSAAGINSDTHRHPQDADSAGDTQQNTGAPI